MATAQVVVTDATNGTPAVGGIFDGLKFFLVQRLPQRSTYVTKIAANGGDVIKLEDRADYLIADHLKAAQAPPASISYKFIDDALATGQLPNPEDHRVGRPPGSVREVGSSIPTKSTRTAFTAEDDKVLWLWVEHAKRHGYSSLKGNEIYKQLEAKNPRHTFQAWRDRYIKYLMDRSPPAGVEVTVAANPPPSPPTAQDAQAQISTAAAAQPQVDASVPAEEGAVNVEAEDEANGSEDDVAEEDPGDEPDFTEEDFNNLMDQAGDIENIPDENEIDAWIAWQGANPEHSVEAWQTFWLEQVRPAYLKSRRAMKRAARDEKRKRKSEAAADFVAQQQAVRNPAEEEDALRQRPGSSSSQNLKRKLDKAESQADDGQKKLRSQAAAAWNEDQRRTPLANQQASSTPLAAGAVSTQPIELLSSDEEDEPAGDNGPLPTSELNRAAQTQLQADEQLARARAFLTSESYKTAQSHLQSNPSASASPAVHNGVHTMSSLPSSDLNRLAEKQLQEASPEQQDQLAERESSPPKTPELAPLNTQAASRRQPSQITPTRLLKTNGDLLTEANLASQQAQHQQSLLRGSDLPEDDEAQDQTDHINALQDLVKEPANAFVPHSSLRVDAGSMNADHPSQSMSLGLDAYDFHPIQDLQMSSQQEIDDAFDGAINWPESPKVAQRVVVQPDSLQFETQVEYPELPLDEPDALEQQDLPSQTVRSAVVWPVSYPALPEEVQEALSEDTSASEDSSESDERERRSKSPSFQQESSYVIVEREEEVSQGESAVQDEIDLSIPEPEGGWEQSSPAKGSVVVVREEIQEIDDEQGHVEAVVAEKEVVEVSSASYSTSSSSESSDDEPTPRRRSPRKLLETQDIVNAETQQPDFDMPLPSDSEENSSSTSSPHRKWSTAEDQAIIEGSRAGMRTPQIKKEYKLKRTLSAIRNRRATLKKQRDLAGKNPIIGRVLLQSSSELRQPRARTAQGSATILEDWMSEDEELLSSPSEDLQSPSRFATSESQRNLPNIQRPPEEDINSYIDKMLVYGYQEQAIIDALKCTSMRPELADYVLLEQKAGKGLPADVAGIWSEEEDRILEGGNARGLRALDEKHTWRELEERRKFLEEWRDEE